ncbi:MAG TPA: 4-hydroxy-tetrahydrodipicolinate reductase [Chloroflexota bacterium]|nr:4-hydroxy-tetrahydrodipicolinate reductase [Chloroflexota bacterium]
MTTPLGIAVAGIGGRMGRQVATAVLADPAFQLTGGTARPESPVVGLDVGQIAGGSASGVLVDADLAAVLRGADVLVDFTTPAVTRYNLDVCREVGRPIVVGTTGLAASDLAHLRETANSIPVFFAANMSVGVNLVVEILPQIARALAAEYDIEIVESHHRHKKDAPSGTALRLAEVIAEALDVSLSDVSVQGRSGLAPRQAGDIGMHSVRAGGIVGEHTVLFASEGEQIEIKHRAYSRQTFVLGALRAARFVVGQPPGLYSMRELLAAG